AARARAIVRGTARNRIAIARIFPTLVSMVSASRFTPRTRSAPLAAIVRHSGREVISLRARERSCCERTSARRRNSMSDFGQIKSVGAFALMVMLLASAAARAQGNPYHVVEGWPTLPPDIKWGAVISVDVDAKWNVWAFHRAQPPILEFDASGKLLKSCVKDMFV